MATQSKRISIAEDFSRFPAGRFREDGDASGTAFREDLLVVALGQFQTVEVVFDGIAGCGSSFLEEAFGGLVRQHGMTKLDLDQRLKLSAAEAEWKDFVALALRYIDQAAKR